MDNLKFVNDVYGHGEGDRILHWVGQFLNVMVRENDFCFRLGGDEFVILLPGVGRSGCRRLMERICEGLRAYDGVFSIPVRLSLGAGTYPENGRNVEELLSSADRAMYSYKREHKVLLQGGESQKQSVKSDSVFVEVVAPTRK